MRDRHSKSQLGVLLISSALLFLTLLPVQADLAILKHTLSRDGRVAIARETLSNGEMNFYFWDTKASRKIGAVLPLNDEVSRVMFITSWNPSSSRVAVLFFYGRRMESLLLFERKGEQFKEVAFRSPDPEALFPELDPKNPHFKNGTGGTANAVGPWSDDDTVRLVIGEERDRDNGGADSFLATFQARTMGGKAKVADLKLVGKLTEKEAALFFKKWGDQYSSYSLADSP